MNNLTQVSDKMRAVLINAAKKAESKTGFVERDSKVDGPAFAQIMVFGFMSNPRCTLSEFAQHAGALGIDLSKQAVGQRMTSAAQQFLHALLGAVTQHVFVGEGDTQSLLNRFTCVDILDSTTMQLPSSLREIWQGNGGKDSGSALKVQFGFDLRSGNINTFDLSDGRASDGGSKAQYLLPAKGGLRLADQGYFNLDVFDAIDKSGAYWLSRLKTKSKIYVDGKEISDLVGWLETQPAQFSRWVQVGASKRLKARLIAVKTPPQVADERRHKLKRDYKERGYTLPAETAKLCGWTLIICNIPEDMLTAQEALVLLRLRWQIECLFNWWKTDCQLDSWRSAKPNAILCEIYAKLIGIIFMHWIVVATAWHYPDRSLRQIARAISKFAMSMLIALHNPSMLMAVFDNIARVVRNTTRLHKRKHSPNHAQLSANPTLCWPDTFA